MVHIVIFPFMSKGHTIPLLHLSRLFLLRGAAVTIFTTAQNHPFISQSLSDTTNVTLIDIPFPDNIPGIPPQTESTDKLHSMSLFIPFVSSTKLMQPFFEQQLQQIHSKVTCIISDGFLPWTLQSASKFSIPRLSFYGMSSYAMVLTRHTMESGLISLHDSPDEPFALKNFPWVKLTRNDFDSPLDKLDPRGPHLDFLIECVVATSDSSGLIFNSFYELEPHYVDYWDKHCQPKQWNVGPFFLAQPARMEVLTGLKPKWIEFLDQKLVEGCPVIYIAFGSQVKISSTQLHEIAIGLEESKVSFLWVTRELPTELIDELEKKVNGRGIVIKEWVDQREILEHEIVQGFLSHCGWNSVLEAICSEVPILAWPMMAEQFLNARMVVEEIKIGLRVNSVDGSVKGFVKGESLKSNVIELMESDKGKELKMKVKEIAEAARKAVSDGGSSWLALNQFIDELYNKQKERNSSNTKSLTDNKSKNLKEDGSVLTSNSVT